MKEKVQERINHVKKLATSPVKGHAVKGAEPFRANDSLSKSIRNSKEADIFLTELNTAFRVARGNKKQ